MRICVIGSGYVGLVTGACLADFGMHVTGVDKDPDIVEALNNHRIPIFEPGLEDLVKRNMEVGRLSFTTDGGRAIQDALAVFIAVGTPPAATGEADLSAIRAVARTIGENLNNYKVVVTKSTVPTGTGDEIESKVLVTDRVAERLLDSGPMPLVSFKDSDRIMLARFQSISGTPRPLAGF